MGRDIVDRDSTFILDKQQPEVLGQIFLADSASKSATR